MKRFVALILCFSLLCVGCAKVGEKRKNISVEQTTVPSVEFRDISNPKLLDYVEENVYASLLNQIDNRKYFVENVEAVYISQEYIDELAYNSQENIYFGYTLSELANQFQGKKFVFSVDDGKTVVNEFQEYDDTYDQIIKNVAVGTGVILICVTVSAVSGGVGAAAVSSVFAVAAKSGTVCALSSGVIGSAASGTIAYMETGDVNESLKLAALEGSKEFKWGAIIGSISGAASQTSKLKGCTRNGLSMSDAAKIQKDSKFSPDTIKQFKSMKEYEVYKKAGLYERTLDGKKILPRDIDLQFKSKLADGTEVNNLKRMLNGLAPLEPSTGAPYELHHINQKAEGTLAILTKDEHRCNSGILHTAGKESEIIRKEFAKYRKQFWKAYGKMLQGKG